MGSTSVSFQESTPAFHILLPSVVLQVDIPLTTIFDRLGDPNPMQWLERSVKFTVCSMPSMKPKEKGNCVPTIPFSPAKNFPLFNHTTVSKFLDYAPACKYAGTSVTAISDDQKPPGGGHNDTTLSPFGWVKFSFQFIW